jgi:hypothetical protein
VSNFYLLLFFAALAVKDRRVYEEENTKFNSLTNSVARIVPGLIEDEAREGKLESERLIIEDACSISLRNSVKH